MDFVNGAKTNKEGNITEIKVWKISALYLLYLKEK